MRRRTSLQGRLIRVLLGAVALVAAVLVAVDYLEFKSGVSERAAQRSAAEGLGEALAGADERTAAAIVQATELQFNRSRQGAGLAGIGDLAFQLQTRSGQPVYASAVLQGLPALGPAQAGADTITVQGRPYWLWWHETPRWQLALLEPVVHDGQLLQWLAGSVLPSLLLALPLLLLPLWWAVRTGLAPLRQLVQALAQRDATSLTPLALDLRHAELQPIVGAIDSLLARARQHVAQERALTHNTAHELRTPLAVIATQAHALTTASDAQAAEAARAGIQRGVQRTAHLVDQLLALARLEAPGPPPAPQAVDLALVCRQHLTDLLALADARGIELALTAPDTLPATVPLAAVQAIVDNLLRNALGHCPPGTQVQLQLDRQGDSLCLCVQDDGPGMPAEEREQAFERFVRGQAAGPGSGLGLAIVREAARQLGGQATLAPGHGGRGLRVTVTWPAA